MNFKLLQHALIITIMFAIMAAGSTNAAGRGPAPTTNPTVESQPTGQAAVPVSATTGLTPLTPENASKIQNIMTLPAENPQSTRFSRDGSLLAYVDLEAVEVWDTQTLTHRATLKYDHDKFESIADLRFSPDGTLLVLVMTKSVDIWNVQTGQLKTSYALPVPEHESCFVELSVDATLIAYTCSFDVLKGSQAAVQIVDVQTGEVKASWNPEQGMVSAITFSPDGTLLATGGARAITKIWDIPSGQQHAVIDTSTVAKYEVKELQFSPDGSQLLIRTGATAVVLWDIQSGQFGKPLQALRTWSFNSDGTLAVYCTNDGLKTSVVNTRTAETVFTFGFESGCHVGAVFSPDSSLLIATSVVYEMKVWDLKKGVVKVAYKDFYQTNMDFSPDGTLLLAISPSTGSQKVRLWGLPRAAAPNATLYGVQYTTDIGSGMGATIPSSWLSPTPRYDIKFTDVEQTVGNCSYSNNHTLLLKGIGVTVTITDLKTKRQVAQRFFKGVSKSDAWKYCPTAWQFRSSTDETIVMRPDGDAVASWIKTTMAKFGLK